MLARSSNQEAGRTSDGKDRVQRSEPFPVLAGAEDECAAVREAGTRKDQQRRRDDHQIDHEFFKDRTVHDLDPGDEQRGQDPKEA